MAFLHSHTEPCLKTELDLFSLPPTQTAVQSSRWVFYKPVSSLSGESPIEFCINGQNKDYLYLTHTLIKVKVQITPYPKEKYTLVAPVNNFLHSVFNRVGVYINKKLVSLANNVYPYRAYLESLLNYGAAAQSSHLHTYKLYDLCAKMKNLKSSYSTETTTTHVTPTPSFITTNEPAGEKSGDISIEQNQYSSIKNKLTSTNSGRISSEQNTDCVDTALCPCC